MTGTKRQDLKSINGDTIWDEDAMRCNLLECEWNMSGVKEDVDCAQKKAATFAFETFEYFANCAREATREPGIAGAPGKVPARDLLRVWDSGASQ